MVYSTFHTNSMFDLSFQFLIQDKSVAPGASHSMFLEKYNPDILQLLLIFKSNISFKKKHK